VNHDLTSSLGTVVYPHSHLCKSVKYRKLSFQLPVSHHAGTIDYRTNRNEKNNKSKDLQGCQKKFVQLRISNVFKVHNAPQTNAINIFPEKDPQYTIPTTFGLALEMLSPLPFLT
jgi:hypothetical protein